MEFNIEQKGNEVVCKIGGRLNTEAATELFEKVNGLVVQSEGKSLVMDCSQLEYISSSGLRLFLKIRKQRNAAVTIIGMNSDIKQIFELTKIDTFFAFE